MVIKNKDGSVYKLNSPNKLVNNQIKFDENIKLHNLKWNPITLKDDNKKTSKKEKKEKVVEEIIEEIKEIKEEKEEPVEEQKPLKNILMSHCLSAVEKEYTDNLYNQNYTKIEYSEKFIFELIAISIEDLTMQIWTNKKINKNSIIFPFKYKDGRKYSDYRWWKATSVKEERGGFIVDFILSDIQPNFS